MDGAVPDSKQRGLHLTLKCLEWGRLLNRKPFLPDDPRQGRDLEAPVLQGGGVKVFTSPVRVHLCMRTERGSVSELKQGLDPRSDGTAEDRD